MAKFSIIDASTGVAKYSGFPTYYGNYLKVSYLEFREIASPTPIDWKIGDYVVWSGNGRTGFTYKLYDIPQPTKRAVPSTGGEAFVYSNVQFHAPTKDLEICPFRDLVKDDNMVHFSTQNAVNTIEPLSSYNPALSESTDTWWNDDGIVARLQACLDDMYSDDETYPGVSLPSWKVEMFSKICPAYTQEIFEKASKEAVFSVSGGSVLDALSVIYDVFGGIGWSYRYGIVTETIGGVTYTNNRHILQIGEPNYATLNNIVGGGSTYPTFSFGKGNGLTSIVRSQTNRDQLATRLFVYGSQRNINFQYYKSNPNILNAQSLDIRNLMIPVSHWGETLKDGTLYKDAHKAFIDSVDGQRVYGVIPKFHYFDGTEDEEIYPTLQGMTIGAIRDAKSQMGDTSFVPSSSVYQDNGERVDEVKDCDNPTDDGLYSSGKKYTSRFVVNNVTETKSSGQLYRTFNENATINLASFTALSNGTLTVKKIYALVTWSKTNLPSLQNTDLWYRSFISVNGEPVYLGFETYPDEWGVEEGFMDAMVDDGFSLDINSGDVVKIGINWRTHGEEQIFWDNQSVDIQAVDSSSFPTVYQIVAAYPRYFNLIIKQVGFDINDMQALGESGLATIAMTNGTRSNGKNTCTGRSFVVKSCQYRGTATDDWLLQCVRAYDSSTGMAYPNNTYTVEAGDQFVLLDIAMPELYIKAAEQRLYDAGLRFLEQASKVQPFWAPEISAIVLDRYLSNISNFKIREGMYLKISDTQLTGGVTKSILIDTITISEGDAEIPTCKIGLREKKSQNFVNSAKALSQSSQALTSVTTKDKTVYKAVVTDILPCSSFADEQVKKVDAGDFDLTENASVRILFTSANTNASPKLKMGYSDEKPIKAYRGGSKVAVQEWAANTVLELRYDGTDWMVVGNPIVSSSAHSGQGDSYELYANGHLRCWGFHHHIGSDYQFVFAHSFSGAAYSATASRATGSSPSSSGQTAYWDFSVSGFLFGWFVNEEVDLRYVADGYAW